MEKMDTSDCSNTDVNDAFHRMVEQFKYLKINTAVKRKCVGHSVDEPPKKKAKMQDNSFQDEQYTERRREIKYTENE